MNNRTIILVCFIVLIAGATNWLLDQNVTEPPTRELSREDPDFFMINASITHFDNAGTVQHKLRASRFTHFPVDDITTLEDPDLDLFSDNGPWNIASRKGRLFPKSTHEQDLVELWGHVVAARESGDGKFTNIQTDSLFIYPEHDYAETEDKVHIDDNSSRTTAAGMEAWLETGQFRFFSRSRERVNTVLEPGQLPAR